MNPAALSRIQAAERRANQRDFAIRYGTHKSHPYGYVPQKRRTARYSATGLLIENLVVVGCLVILAAVIALTATK
ncbi:MAG TPA: hypothetical protein VFH39_03395 [Candidatus Saccharimonadales bacterium]|nr:hypothetical protein [Candidatus Saccharimonadales bacterium]